MRTGRHLMNCLLVLWFSAFLTIPAYGGSFEDGKKAYDRGDYPAALEIWKPLAEQGIPAAQLGLGFMYNNGQGVPQDYAEAVKWYRKAAEQGHAEAQSNLGVMYAKGQGVPQDYVPAHMWFSLAASRLPASEKKKRNKAVSYRDIVASKMTPDQITEAQRLAQEWKPRKESVKALPPHPQPKSKNDSQKRRSNDVIETYFDFGDKPSTKDLECFDLCKKKGHDCGYDTSGAMRSVRLKKSLKSKGIIDNCICFVEIQTLRQSRSRDKGDVDQVGSSKNSLIAFVSDRDGNEEIYVMSVDGADLTRLTNNPAKDMDPAWSPDHKKIVFVSDRDGNAEIYVMNANGSGLSRLTNNPANDVDPAWAPDGQHIVFVSDRGGNIDIYLMNVEGAKVTRLTKDPGIDLYPSWSPDSRRIAYISDRHGESGLHLGGTLEIYLMNADGTNVSRLTHLTVTEKDVKVLKEPAWSPDGNRIAFVATHANNEEIYVINTDGSDMTRLTNNRTRDAHPAWSPDGQKIVFVSNRDGNAEIYMMKADGSDVRRLTKSPTVDYNPAW